MMILVRIPKLNIFVVLPSFDTTINTYSERQRLVAIMAHVTGKHCDGYAWDLSDLELKLAKLASSLNNEEWYNTAWRAYHCIKIENLMDKYGRSILDWYERPMKVPDPETFHYLGSCSNCMGKPKPNIKLTLQIIEE